MSGGSCGSDPGAQSVSIPILKRALAGPDWFTTEKIEMPIVRIEHAVPNFEKWKEAFDRDPVDRKGSGVRRYRVLRAHDDPNYVMIDLEFDDQGKAEEFVRTMERLWMERAGLSCRIRDRASLTA
jgi:hypothetical protein